METISGFETVTFRNCSTPRNCYPAHDYCAYSINKDVFVHREAKSYC